MRGRNADRAVAGRHTLGSLPESQEPRDLATVPPLPALPPLENLTDSAEPIYTICGKAWYAARERAHAEGEQRRILVRLLDVMEAGWLAVRDLQHWFENNQERALQKDAYGHLLSFVAGDLVDVYRDLAGGVADLVPGWEGWESEADPDGVLADVDTFERYLTILNLAVRAAPAPEAFPALVASVENRVTGLSQEVTVLVSALWSGDDRTG
jgi:hypothetical protein